MTQASLKAIIDGVAKATREHIAELLAPVYDRLKDVESQKAEKGEKGDPGDQGPAGKSAYQIWIDLGNEGSEADFIASLRGPAGEKGLQGEAGTPGKSAFQIWKELGGEGEEADFIASIKGDKGESGERGADGQDGKSLTLDDIAPLIKSMQAEWALDFERRAQDVLQKAIDRIPVPKDGRDGIDGLGFDDMRLEHDGKRSVKFIFERGDVRKEIPVTFPCVIDAGFWKEGMKVEKGDGVTFGGSYWIAQRETDSKPEIGNPDWRLAVKKGRDAKQSARID